jgi:hypothetical protein
MSRALDVLRGVVVSYLRFPCTPHGGLRTFHQKSTYTVMIDSKDLLRQIGHVTPQNLGSLKPFVAHRVGIVGGALLRIS